MAIGDQLFSAVDPENREIKMVVKGREGTGKTRTSTEIIIGAMKRTRDPRPVYWFATEPGIDFVLPLFKRAGIPVEALRTYKLPPEVLAKKGEFLLFAEACGEARRRGAGALIVDSASHVWDDFLERHAPKPGADIRDWAVPKKRWAKALEFLIHSPFHVAFLARAGDKYAQETKPNGKQTLTKQGERAKLQADTEYEFSFVFEMIHQGERAGERAQLKVRKQRTLDKSLEGKVIDNPTFEHLNPLWEWMAWDLKAPAAALEPAPAPSQEELFPGMENAMAGRNAQEE